MEAVGFTEESWYVTIRMRENSGNNSAMEEELHENTGDCNSEYNSIP